MVNKSSSSESDSEVDKEKENLLQYIFFALRSLVKITHIHYSVSNA